MENHVAIDMETGEHGHDERFVFKPPPPLKPQTTWASRLQDNPYASEISFFRA